MAPVGLARPLLGTAIGGAAAGWLVLGLHYAVTEGAYALGVQARPPDLPSTLIGEWLFTRVAPLAVLGVNVVVALPIAVAGATLRRVVILALAASAIAVALLVALSHEPGTSALHELGVGFAGISAYLLPMALTDALAWRRLGQR